MQTIKLWTDGSVNPTNPGEFGGWGTVFQHGHSSKFLRIYSDFCENPDGKPATNNAMELRAVIEGLKKLKFPCVVRVFTDSFYVLSGINKWNETGRLHGTNKQVWIEYTKAAKNHQIIPVKIAGHDGVEFNELAHKLAFYAAKHQLIFDNYFLSAKEARVHVIQTLKNVSKSL